MERTIWMPCNSRLGGPTASPDGLISTLRNLPAGHTVIVPGWKATQVRNHMRAARRGTDKWFESRTLTIGAEIRRSA